MSDSIKDRLMEYIESIGSNPRRFSLSIGKSDSYVRTIKGSVGANVIGEILRIYPDLNTNWLITGVGEMRVQSQRTIKENNDGQEILLERLEKKSEEIGELKARIRELERQLEKKTEKISKPL